jgi:hypothetical protein
MAHKPINPYWLGAKFIKHCVKQDWLTQQGPSERGTKCGTQPTMAGRKYARDFAAWFEMRNI